MKNESTVSLEAVKQALSEVLDSRQTMVHINFAGDLAQLARILKPEIDVETSRKGDSLGRGTVL